MTFSEAITAAMDGKQLRLPEHLPGYYLWYHKADDVLYVQRGPLQPFSRPARIEMQSNGWEEVTSPNPIQKDGE